LTLLCAFSTLSAKQYYIFIHREEKTMLTKISTVTIFAIVLCVQTSVLFGEDTQETTTIKRAVRPAAVTALIRNQPVENEKEDIVDEDAEEIVEDSVE
jgi:hypothetical protein